MRQLLVGHLFSRLHIVRKLAKGREITFVLVAQVLELLQLLFRVYAVLLVHGQVNQERHFAFVCVANLYSIFY